MATQTNKARIEKLNGGIFKYSICFNRTKPKFNLKKDSVDDFIVFKKSKSNKELTEPSKINKSVSFNLQPQVHTMHVWLYAHRQARINVYTQDHNRFLKKITNISKIILPTLNKMIEKTKSDK